MNQSRVFRRSMVFGAAVVLGAAVGVGAGPLPEGEVLYLADSHYMQHADHDEHTHLFRVVIDEGGDKADLVMLPNGTIPLAEVHAIAATPDGERIYAVDRLGNGFAGTSAFGYYDVPTASWNPVGFVTHNGNLIPAVVLAGFSPAGELIIGSGQTDRLYRLDPSTGVATEIGPIYNVATNAFVDLNGADLAFSANGVAYLWTNGSAPGAPYGLYSLMIPPVPGPIAAAVVGNVPGDYFTGIAVRGNGFGDIVGSSTQPGNQIHVHSKADGSDVGASPFQMYVNGAPYQMYAYGDMTNGPLGFVCTRTIGYWMNHDWPVSVALCDDGIGTPVVVDQALGQAILQSSKGKDFSMLTAQLLAAKLNTGGSGGFGFIDDAEAFLCNAVDTTLGSWWTTSFADKDQKSGANALKDALDYFNNENQCGY